MDASLMDWARLERLRKIYLGSETERWESSSEGYWESDEDLRLYDLVLAERIGWKWDAVLKELSLRGWTPQESQILDWGCGSAIESRRVIDFFGVENFSKLVLWDRSARAREWSKNRLSKKWPSLTIEVSEDAKGLVLLSHVLNELTESETESLCHRLQSAREIIWVEPGTPEISRKLGRMRERLLKIDQGKKSEFSVVAPCTHQKMCGVFSPENERHWCHNFSYAPSEIHQDSGWSLVARKLGIDLRRISYSFLVLTKNKVDFLGEDVSRVIGEARHQKGFSKILSCDGQRGVAEIIVQKRDAPQLIKTLKEKESPSLYRFEMEENGSENKAKQSKVKAGRAL